MIPWKIASLNNKKTKQAKNAYDLPRDPCPALLIGGEGKDVILLNVGSTKLKPLKGPKKETAVEPSLLLYF